MPKGGRQGGIKILSLKRTRKWSKEIANINALGNPRQKHFLVWMATENFTPKGVVTTMEETTGGKGIGVGKAEVGDVLMEAGTRENRSGIGGGSRDRISEVIDPGDLPGEDRG